MMNVTTWERYKTFPKESKAMLRDKYGKLPKYRETLKKIAKSDKDVLCLALFPQMAPKFLAWRDGPHEAQAPKPEPPIPAPCKSYICGVSVPIKKGRYPRIPSFFAVWSPITKYIGIV